MRIAKTLKSFLIWLKIMKEEDKIMEEETLTIMTEEEEEEIMEEETLKSMTEEEKSMTEEEKIMEKETLKIMTEEEEEEEEIIIMEMWTTPILLPQEIHIEILSWIPAKSLISSFKLVCKSWRNLIKDPDFIKMHLNRGRSSRNRSNNETLVRKSKSGNAIYQLHQPPFNFGDKGLVFLNPIIEEAKKMDIDSSLLELKTRLVGSCNGLLCLSVAHDNETIILLNPSTRKYRASPKQVFDITDSIFPKPVTYGFGCYYNSTADIDEYKVVRMAYFYPFGHEDDENNRYFEFQIDIYSMSSNSWRRWTNVKEEEDVVPYEISLHRPGVFVNGAFHWMGCKRRSGYIWDTIVSFNIRDEEFGPQVPVPPPCEIVIGFYDDEYPYIKNDSVLMNVRGYLGNVYFSRDEMTDIELEIWVMKEYGIKESWTKQFVIISYDSNPPCELYGSSIYSTAMSCFLIGDQILIEGRVFFGSKGASMRKGKGYERVILYDMNKKKINGEFGMVDIPSVAQDDQVDYIETLVSLESSVFPLSNNQKRKDMESLRNQIFGYSCEV